MPNQCLKLLKSFNLAKVFLAISFLSASLYCPAADIKLPMLGDSSSGIVSKNQEYKLGRAWLQALRRHVKQHDDPLIQTYLEQLTYDLITFGERGRRPALVLVNNPSINAFAVQRLLLASTTNFTHADNEDQLASIISHGVT